MADILILGDNVEFITDLQDQIQRFINDVQFVDDSPDIIIIDENKVKYTELRQKYPNVPMVLLGTDSGQNNDALNINIKKPLRLMAFLDIVRAANHRLDHSTDGYLRFNGYELHPSHKDITDLRTARKIKLTEREVGILKYLFKNSNVYVSKTDLQTNVWQYNEEVATHTIETHIYRLRQKVETEGRRLILTDNGCYKLITDGDENA
jgi:DNA-binding response OmpR family regulator